MIYCLLIQVSRNQQGQAINKESVVSGGEIKIGRDASCDIRLFDDQVAPLHATLKQSKDGALYLESGGDASFRIDGSDQQISLLLPGDRVEIGPYLLTVDPASVGDNIALSVEALLPPPEHSESLVVSNEALSIADLQLSKRKWAYRLAAAVSFLFILLPVLPSLSSAMDKWQAKLPVTLTDSWSAGPLAGGHSAFGRQCSTCHQHAFRSVPDEACTGCHKSMQPHFKNDELHARLFKDTRCTTCHVDHQGGTGLIKRDSARCVACHGDIKSKDALTKLSDVHDFSTDHPPFRISLRNSNDQHTVERVPQNQKDKVQEKSGLKFSHKVHLDKKGIATPGGDIVMKCADCHQVDAAGTHFEPMTMKKSCQQSGCHGLDFMSPVEGNVPHGSEREAMNRIREYFAKSVADSNSVECERTNGNALQLALSCVYKLARDNAAASLFVADAGCGECHVLAETGEQEVPWKVERLNINLNWFAKSVFPHARHSTVECVSCHDKLNSQTSADIAMPDIAKCRECHTGEHSARGKVKSACSTCHQFHGGGDAAKMQ